MASTYPGATDTFSPQPPVDGLHDVKANDIAQLQNAIIAIEEAVGIDPQGSMGSLAERLAVRVGNDGTIVTDVAMGEISYFSITGTAVVIAATSDGLTNMVKCAPTTAFDGDATFDNGGANNGRLRYVGTETRMFHVACTFSFSPATVNDTFVLGVAKNGTVIAASRVLMKVSNSGDARSSAIHIMVELATNDYIELYVGNTTDADDLTIHSINLFAMGIV